MMDGALGRCKPVVGTRYQFTHEHRGAGRAVPRGYPGRPACISARRSAATDGAPSSRPSSDG